MLPRACGEHTSKPFTRTSRKNPASARRAKPSASFASVLFAAISRAALAWRIDADGNPSARAHDRTKQRAGFEHDALCGRRPLADKLGNDPGIRCALPAPDPFAFTADRHCRLFHRHVETDMFFHGCSPLMLGPASSREPVFHLIGEQPPSKAMIGSRARRSRDYPMWTPPHGIAVPKWCR